MLDLQPFGQIGNASCAAAGHAFYGEQELMLLGLESGRPGGVFAESEKAANLIAELGYGLIVRKLEFDRSTFRSHSYISYHDISCNLCHWTAALCFLGTRV